MANNEIKISPIFYMGNKRRLINKGLLDYFPKDIGTFVDVFAGSGIVSMNVSAKHYFLNDINVHLNKLYEMFSTTDSKTIINHINKRIEEYGLPKEKTKRHKFNNDAKLEHYKKAYYKFRDYVNENPNILDLYTLSFFSFSRQFRFNSDGQFNMPFGSDYFCKENEHYICNGCNFFSELVNYYNLDFSEFITTVFNILKHLSLNSEFNSSELIPFFYFDPPYLNTMAVYNESRAGITAWNEQSEQTLYNILDDLSSKGYKWALSNDLGRNTSLSSWLNNRNYNAHTFKINYAIYGKGNQTAVKEFLITNYDCQIKSRTNKILF